jgi:uncharacterized protein involved in exopolysaccharide biosynthesis
MVQARPHDTEVEDRALRAIESIEQELRDLRQRVTSIERRLADEDV